MATADYDTRAETLRKRVLQQQQGFLAGEPTTPGPVDQTTLTSAPFDTSQVPGQPHATNTGIAAPLPAAPAPVTPVAGQQGGGRTYDAAPAGFDQTKWMDPTYNSPKYQVSRIIGQYGHSAEGLRAALPQIQALYPGASIDGSDRLNFGANQYEGQPLGTVDVIRDVGGANGAFWNPEQAAGARVMAPPTPAPAGAAPAAALGTNSALRPGTGSTEAEWQISQQLAGLVPQGAPANATSAAAAPTFNDEVRQMILARLRTQGQPVNESDAQIAQPLSAARNETERQLDRGRTELAERLYAQGGGLQSNALTQGIQQSRERAAGGLSTLRANLITRELESRRAELRDLLSLATASGDSDTARQVQLQMQAIENELRREFKGVDLATFGAQLNQNAALAGLNG